MPQGKIHTTSGFTLVEIMIAIVIIVLLSQTGNVLSLFQSRQKSELEGITVGILNAIDEEKTHALLGKTKDKEIVRKRKLSIASSGNALNYEIGINKAKEAENAAFVVESTRTVQLLGNTL